MPFIEIFLIILGAVVVGIILSVGIIYLIRRFERPKYPPKKYIIPSPQSSSIPSKTAAASTAPKNGSKDDKLEELLKNHKRIEPVGVKASSAWLQPSTAKQSPVVAPSSTLRPPVVAPSSSPRPNVIASPVVKQPPVVAPSATLRPSAVASPTAQQAAPAAPPVAKQPTVVTPKPAAEKPKAQLPRSDVYKELESNLSIATAPWLGKVTAFQTTAWDNNQDKIEPELADRHGEITEVYIDIRLANNIVWISNELGNKSPNLDESYRKLCAKIAERIRKVVAPVNGNR